MESFILKAKARYYQIATKEWYDYFYKNVYKNPFIKRDRLKLQRNNTKFRGFSSHKIKALEDKIKTTLPSKLKIWLQYFGKYPGILSIERSFKGMVIIEETYLDRGFYYFKQDTGNNPPIYYKEYDKEAKLIATSFTEFTDFMLTKMEHDLDYRKVIPRLVEQENEERFNNRRFVFKNTPKARADAYLEKLSLKGYTNEAIGTAEQELNVVFPEAFRWCLKYSEYLETWFGYHYACLKHLSAYKKEMLEDMKRRKYPMNMDPDQIVVFSSSVDDIGEGDYPEIYYFIKTNEGYNPLIYYYRERYNEVAVVLNRGWNRNQPITILDTLCDQIPRASRYQPFSPSFITIHEDNSVTEIRQDMFADLPKSIGDEFVETDRIVVNEVLWPITIYFRKVVERKFQILANEQQIELQLILPHASFNQRDKALNWAKKMQQIAFKKHPFLRTWTKNEASNKSSKTVEDNPIVLFVSTDFSEKYWMDTAEENKLYEYTDEQKELIKRYAHSRRIPITTFTIVEKISIRDQTMRIDFHSEYGRENTEFTILGDSLNMYLQVRTTGKIIGFDILDRLTFNKLVEWITRLTNKELEEQPALVTLFEQTNSNSTLDASSTGEDLKVFFQKKRFFG